ncbi:hypothetical protein WJX81_004915 [Elliptochloris bilobata]|uniref:Uncharacterized protein n=1 Tax=Elliptochloris bilobata TaxID=381761 RepID=A0AAW1RFG7_9CHLO
MESWRRYRRHALTAAAIGAAGAAGLYYHYRWWRPLETAQGDAAPGNAAHRPGVPAALPPAAQPAPELREAPPNAALVLEREADANLANHFSSVQAISDSTTLPQMLLELAQHLNSASNVDVLVLQLKQLKSRGGGAGAGAASPAEKQALWRELAAAGFARAAAAVWLMPLLNLLLRVQLNILGRHLFLESNLLDPSARLDGWGASAGPGGGTGRGGGGVGSPAAVRIGKAAQEQFLEYAHYLPERGAGAAVAGLKAVAAGELDGLGLHDMIDQGKVLAVLSVMHSQFEAEVAARGGWAALALPSAQEAALYFATYQQQRQTPARADASALKAGAAHLAADADVVRALVAEVATVLDSTKFGEALAAAVREAARALAAAVAAEMRGAGGALPVAKAVPLVSNAADALLAPGPRRGELLASLAALPTTERLCATVYSCGPPL